MPKIVWSLICKQTALTPDGDIVINGEFAIANVPDLPGKSPPFFIISRVTGHPSEVFKFRLRIIEPAGKDIIDDGWQDFGIGEDGFAFLTLQMNGVIFPAFGDYRVELWINNQRSHVLPLIMKKKATT